MAGKGNPNIGEIGKATRFKKNDTSVNRGRPALPPEVKAFAQSYALDGIKIAAEIMTDTTQPANFRLMALNTLLDRGYGKAPQAITGDGGGDVGIKITVEYNKLSVESKEPEALSA